MNDDFFMPPDWHPHTATWLSWPKNTDTWSQNLEAAQLEFESLIQTIARFEPVCLMHDLNNAPDLNFDLTDVELIPIATNDAWVRDYAPTFVHNDEITMRSIDWHYNAWGGKYPPFDDDQKVAAKIAKHLNLDNVKVDLCLEGGALEINDSRILITTRSCVLANNRNPDTSSAEAESLLKMHLGVSHVIWLPGDAIEGDDTDGHIDQLARFTDDTTIVHAWTSHPNDPRRAAIAKNVKALKSGIAEIPFECRFIALPLPEPIQYCGLTLPASYCNFVIVNGGVIVPQFDQPDSDARAVEILSQCFADHEIVPLRSKNLSVGLGSFHCLTQHQPQLKQQN